ncbi:MAG TPA: hypothetical protein VM431_06905 [Phycisphaerae bacterium]|nr:hypothetical protein [Phycisphaerae bacterium]
MTLSRTVVLSMLAIVAAGLVLSGCQKETPEAGPPKAGDAASAPPAEIQQKACPVMGGAINPAIYVDHEGRRIYFCCQACVAKFKQDPATYIAKVDAELKGAGGGQTDTQP